MFLCLAFIGNEIYIDETDITNFCERCMKSQMRDASCVITDYFDDFSMESFEFSYSAAQICPNQNIRVMRVGPIRVYAYAYTHIRVCIYAHTRIQYIRVCLIGMYELTYCFFLFLQVIVIFNGLRACHRARKSFLYFDKQAT